MDPQACEHSTSPDLGFAYRFFYRVEVPSGLRLRVSTGFRVLGFRAFRGRVLGYRVQGGVFGEGAGSRCCVGSLREGFHVG